MAIRKFLIGQTAQLVLQSKAMKRMRLCPKKVFDDIYLHLENQARAGNNVSEEAQEQFSLIEAEHTVTGVLRSILFKHKDLTNNLMDSLQASNDFSNFNTCEDYQQTSRM